MDQRDETLKQEATVKHLLCMAWIGIFPITGTANKSKTPADRNNVVASRSMSTAIICNGPTNLLGLLFSKTLQAASVTKADHCFHEIRTFGRHSVHIAEKSRVNESI
jgi:hypothetical protein